MVEIYAIQIFLRQILRICCNCKKPKILNVKGYFRLNDFNLNTEVTLLDQEMKLNRSTGSSLLPVCISIIIMILKGYKCSFKIKVNHSFD